MLIQDFQSHITYPAILYEITITQNVQNPLKKNKYTITAIISCGVTMKLVTETEQVAI